MSNDVAIIGVGIHPFGRFDKTAMEMGAEAITSALADAKLEWNDIQFGFGGSYEVSKSRRRHAPGRPHRHHLHQRLQRLRHLGQRHPADRRHHPVGQVRHRYRDRPGQASARRPSPTIPAKLALPQWYANNGQFVTTKFFGIKANHYIHKHGISEETLARVANKNFRNGVLNPNAFRRKEISVEEIMASPVLNYPLRQYMFCAPDEGAAAVIMCRADIAHKYTDKPVYVRASEIRTRTFGAYEVHATSAPLDEDPSPTVFAAKAAYEAAGIGARRRRHRANCRTPTPAPRSSTWPRPGCAPTVSRRSC